MNLKYLCAFLFVVTLVDGQFDDPFKMFSSAFPSFPSFSSFPSFGSMFSNIGNLGESIRQSIDKQMKPMRLKNDISKMADGQGGLTVMAMPGKTLLRREATTFECLGTIVPRPPFCLGQMRRFQIQNQQDFCYSNHYTVQGNAVCVGHPEQKGLSISAVNGHYTCAGSDERPTLLITLDQYRQGCGRNPWDVVYHYFPGPDRFFAAKLPNPDLNCYRSDVCSFRKGPNGFIL